MRNAINPRAAARTAPVLYSMLALLATPAALAGGPIINGDFSTSVPWNATGGGWTSSGINISGGWEASLGNPAPSFFLNASGGGGDPTLTQTVSGLTPGGCYILSGDFTSLARNESPAGVPSLTVKVNGQLFFTSVPTVLQQWKSLAIPFTAPANGTVTISLSAEINGTDNDFLVDNICLTPCCLTENGGFDVFVPSDATGGRWTTANTSLGGWTASGGNPDAYFYLNQFGQGGVDPTASQTITGLTAGACYVLTGDYASIAHDDTPPDVDSLAIDISGTGTVFLAKPTALGDWTSFAVSFIAPIGGVVTVTFRAEINGTDNDFGIDNICLTPGCIGEVVENGHFDTQVPNDATGGGWTTANTSLGGWSASGGNPDAYFYLNQFGQVGVDPTASQTITGLTAGAYYVLTGDYATISHDFSPANTDSFAVYINGGAPVFVAQPTPIGVWTHFAIQFIAPPGGTVTITLAAEIGATDNDFGIDNICLAPRSAPPCSIAPTADLNCDCVVDFFDIDPFLLALFDEPGYAAAYPDCNRMNADADHSGIVDFFDIDPFLACLFGTCP